MRAIRTWGSVRGVPGNWHSYRERICAAPHIWSSATHTPTMGSLVVFPLRSGTPNL